MLKGCLDSILVGRLMIERLQVQILAEMAAEFSSPELTLCADSYSVSVLPRVTVVACKRPWSFCQKCMRLVTSKHPYTLDPKKSEWADYAAIKAQCGNLSRNQLTRNLSGNTQPQPFQLTEPLWTDPGLQSGISVRMLISTSKKDEKKKKRRQGMIGQTFSPILCK